ncbi:MAG TPA: hypothetical protein VE379_07200 [Vicinamibacterales bacterium]|jgi:hypothetical protein|nr:hypothetical protein [Vicinamibacterales bacterium]
MNLHPPSPGRRDPHADLERALFEEYLRVRGYTWESLAALPSRPQAELLRDAAGYATLKLSEIEARALYVESIGGQGDRGYHPGGGRCEGEP